MNYSKIYLIIIENRVEFDLMSLCIEGKCGKCCFDMIHSGIATRYAYWLIDGSKHLYTYKRNEFLGMVGYATVPVVRWNSFKDPLEEFAVLGKGGNKKIDLYVPGPCSHLDPVSLLCNDHITIDESCKNLRAGGKYCLFHRVIL